MEAARVSAIDLYLKRVVVRVARPRRHIDIAVAFVRTQEVIAKHAGRMNSVDC